ncbi:MAG: HD domain-containing phosphohydrolase, partial [Myxococcota bacterium]
KDVIVEYDINDYKSKTELTHQRMFTMVYTSLSSYRDLIALNANRAGLKSIIEASATLFDLHEAEHFAHGVLRQLTSLLYLGSPSRAERAAALVAVLDGDEPRAIAERGQLGDPRAAAGADASGEGGAGDDRALPAQVAERVIRAANERCSVSGRDYFAGYLPDCGPHATVLYVEGSDPFTVPDWQMVELFCRNAAIAQENISLKRESEDTQREIVYLLGEAIEKRSNETGNHVRRVGEYCRLLGRLSELPAEEAEILLLAAPLHDAGKIAIPDAILNKPGRHTPDEQAIMRTHARHGAELLSGYERPVLKAAAIIAAQHHEKWDGSGYPLGLRGTEIHIYGRIAALADVFDALGSDRCYKAAWPLERILNLVRDERGKHFDPALVDLFLGHIEQFLAIRDRYSDRYSEGGERST